MKSKYYLSICIAIVVLSLVVLGIFLWVKQDRMKQTIIKYLVTESNEKETVAKRIYNDLAVHKDVLKEFYEWVCNRRYPDETEGAIVVQGYTAEKLNEVASGRLSPVEIYDYLVFLRKNPDRAQKTIIGKFGEHSWIVNNENGCQAVTVSKVERARMEKDIIDYLTKELKEQYSDAEGLSANLAAHGDLLKEFHTWLKNRRYPDEKEGAVVVKGYTAGKFAEAVGQRLSPIVVYDYLVYLREEPGVTLKTLNQHFGMFPWVVKKQKKCPPVSKTELAKMKQDIINYLMIDCNESADTAKRDYNVIAKHEDILKEFHTWIKTKHYPEDEEAVVVQGFSAKKFAARGVPPLGTFTSLVWLRENPSTLNLEIKERLKNWGKNKRARKIYIDFMRRSKKYTEKNIKNHLKKWNIEETVATGLNMKMSPVKQDIINYLIVERNKTDSEAEKIFNGFAKYEDILKEFHAWVKTKHYPTKAEGALVLHGYTAKKIAVLGQGIIDPVEVYQYLVKLKEKPKETLEDLKNGISFIIIDYEISF